MSEKKKILVTGSKGMMGSDTIPQLEMEYRVIPTDLKELDITKFAQVKNILEAEQPDWVVHMAALTDLDFCEENPETADLVNHRGTRNIAEVCAENGIGMIYISTSGIFSGKKRTPYNEEDIPNPKNAYGMSKYHGELAVRELLPEDKWLILRAGWLFGGGEKDIKFVGKIYKLCHEWNELSAVDDIFGSPNYTLDIGDIIIYLIKNKYRGVFHVGNKGVATRFDIAREIVSAAEVECNIIPVPSTMFPTVAPRPPMEAICSAKLDSLGYRIRPWQDALKDYIGRLKCE